MTLLSLATGPAAALGLGRIATQSSLGEPLRIEIEVSSITPEEASSLQVRIAGPEAYQKAGVEYNPILSSARAVLQRRPDGRTVLRLVSDRVVQEPFVELILDLAWPSGHLVRSYTLLIDPPATRTAGAGDSATPPVAPGVNAALSSAQPLRAPVVRPTPLPAPVAPPPRRTAAAPPPVQSGMVAPPGSEFEPRVEAQPAPVPRLADVRPAEGAAAGRSAGADRYLVRPGDTLAAIAARTRPSGVSLDQMLASLYRANSGAFIGNSIHRLRSGVVLNVPSADEARALAPQQARQTIQAQSADFNAYRRGLASAARDDRPEDASRRASGSLQAAVDDRRRAAASSPDRLTLSKDANAAASFNDALASLQRERQDAEVRLSALMRNIEELKALAGQAAASAAVGSAAASQPVISPRPLAAGSEPIVGIAPAASAPPIAVMPTTPAASAGLAGDVIATPPLPVPSPVTPAAAVMPPRVLPAEVPPEPDSFLASLIEESALPLALAALLLTGALLYGARQLRRRRAGTQSETSFLDSSLKVDSFLAGGDNLPPDSRQMPVGTLSSGYSLSQLDAGGDVDPVAEADVYLAYGRDLQAEEILKDAMRSDPDRLAIRTKLLEVYAKRRDTNGFEVLASQLHALTLGQGDDWELAQQLGRGIDPENPLYAPGGTPRRDDVDFEGADDPLGPNTLPQVVLLGEGEGELDGDSPVDIELDFDLDEPAAVQPSLRSTASQVGDLPPLDFGPTRSGAEGLRPGTAAAAAAVTLGSSAVGGQGAPRDATPDLLDLDLLDLPVSPAAASLASGASPAAAGGAGAVDATPDLLDLDLLDFAPTPAAAAAPRASASPPAAPASVSGADDATPDLLDLDLLDLPASASPPVPPSAASSPAPSPGDFSLAFDLSSISLDLDAPAGAVPAAPAPPPGLGAPDAGDIDFFAPAGAVEPVQRKLDLAEELLQLGDSEGARDLLNEVLGHAGGAQKTRAESLLAQLP